jgi:histidine ammonia-lyase
VLAIELIAACQALEFLRPLKVTEPLESVYAKVRACVKPWTGDRYMAPDIEASWQLLKSGDLVRSLAAYLSE